MNSIVHLVGATNWLHWSEQCTERKTLKQWDSVALLAENGGRSVKLTSHLPPVPTLRIRGPITPLLHTLFCRGTWIRNGTTLLHDSWHSWRLPVMREIWGESDWNGLFCFTVLHILRGLMRPPIFMNYRATATENAARCQHRCQQAYSRLSAFTVQYGYLKKQCTETWWPIALMPNYNILSYCK
jgi:hypothetical protein